MDIVNFEISQKCHEISKFLQKPEGFSPYFGKTHFETIPVNFRQIQDVWLLSRECCEV